MTVKSWCKCSVVVLFVALAVAACNDSNPNPQSPDHASLVSGTVVFDQTGAPAPGVSVDLEHHRSGTMMMSHEWDHAASMTTDSHGRFHFEYRHESMHNYRVMVHGATDPQGMCYINGGDEQSIVLRIP